MLSKAEQEQTLQMLQDSLDEVMRQLQRMPLNVDTMSQKKKKQALEAQSQQLEKALTTFSRPKVFVQLEA